MERYETNTRCYPADEGRFIYYQDHLTALREQQNAIAKGLEKWAEGGRFKPEIGAWIRSCAKYVRAFEPGKEDGEDGK